MSETAKLSARKRIDLSKIRTAIPIPNLIEVQKRSYDRFLQIHTPPADRENTGLQAVFKSVFPIRDFRQTCSLEFVEYTIGNWECRCGRLKGVENSRARCKSCDTLLPAGVELTEKEICPYCSAMRKIDVPNGIPRSSRRGDSRIRRS